MARNKKRRSLVETSNAKVATLGSSLINWHRVCLKAVPSIRGVYPVTCAHVVGHLLIKTLDWAMLIGEMVIDRWILGRNTPFRRHSADATMNIWTDKRAQTQRQVSRFQRWSPPVCGRCKIELPDQEGETQ